MDKNIGFRRNIYRTWMDAAAAFCAETQDLTTLKERLDPIVGQQVKNADNRREAIDILLNIWAKSADAYPDLQAEALRLFQESIEVDDRLWVHYGMALLTYDFFRLGVSIIGQLSRYADAITPKDVKPKVMAERGQFGAVEKATERILFSLRDWGVLAETGRRYTYAPQRRAFTASAPALEEWMLTVALTAHPAEEVPFADLVRLPELFPFRFSVGIDQLRRSQRLAVHRQGLGLDMVRVAATAR